MKILLKNHNGILNGLEKHFEIVNTLDEAEAVVLWQDIMGFGKSISSSARLMRIPVIVVQHGRKATKDYCPPLNYKFTPNKICVWGTDDRDRLLEAGISQSKMEITGSLIFSHLKGREPHKGTNIVFCPAHHDVEIKENYVVADALRKIKGLNIITKIIESNQSDKFDNPVFSNVDAPNHLDVCAEVLSKADLVVSLKDGTFELLAYSLNIPVVIPMVWEDRTMLGRFSPESFSKACDLIELFNLEKVVRENLENPDKLQNERKDVVMTEGGIYIKDPLQKIINVIKNA